MGCCASKCGLRLSHFGACPCCCTVPISSEKLPLLDDVKMKSSDFGLSGDLCRIQMKSDRIFNPKDTDPNASKFQTLKKNMIRVVTMSDSHMRHRSYRMPKGDILLVAGDFTNWKTSATDIEDFILWLKEMIDGDIYAYICVICGNHEMCLINMNEQQIKDKFNYQNRIFYLQDSSLKLFGLLIHGAPFHPQRGILYQARAFGATLNELKSKHALISDDSDIVMSHCPPLGMGDKETAGNVGSESLLKNVTQRVKPYLHVYGHCHGGRGLRFIEGCDTYFMNTACHHRTFDFIFSAAMSNDNDDNDDDAEQEECKSNDDEGGSDIYVQRTFDDDKDALVVPSNDDDKVVEI